MHYVIFGHNGTTPFDCRLHSGQSNLPGYDFQVTIWRQSYLPSHGYICPPDNFSERCQRLEGGTFMHELGHNLDLHHGGDVDENYKPNYVSQMNYLFQFSGIPYGNSPDDVAASGHRVDYSDHTYAALDENHLDEGAGLSGATDSLDFTRHPASCFDPRGFYYLCYPDVHVHGPIDWNNNGAIEPDVQYDVNFAPTDFDQTYSVLWGFDDWGHVQGFLNTPAYRTGRVQPGPAMVCDPPDLALPSSVGGAP